MRIILMLIAIFLLLLDDHWTTQKHVTEALERQMSDKSPKVVYAYIIGYNNDNYAVVRYNEMNSLTEFKGNWQVGTMVAGTEDELGNFQENKK